MVEAARLCRSEHAGVDQSVIAKHSTNRALAAESDRSAHAAIAKRRHCRTTARVGQNDLCYHRSGDWQLASVQQPVADCQLHRAMSRRIQQWTKKTAKLRHQTRQPATESRLGGTSLANGPIPAQLPRRTQME